MPDDAVRRLRLRAQRLEPRSTAGVADVVRAVCGIQAQDAAAARLSVRARAEGATAAEVDAAEVVRTWAWRGTLHLLAAEDVAWVLALVAPGAIRGRRARWRQLGLDDRLYGRARATIREALDEGPRTRAQLRDRLAAEGIDASGQRLPHLLGRAALEGLLQHRLDDTFAALDPGPAPPREQALGRLAARYLAAYGPAGAADLAKWSGLPAADVKAAWAAEDTGRPAAEVTAASADADVHSVRLLPSFDTYLLGYATRDDMVDREHARRVWPGGGWLHPVVLVDGRAAGTWNAKRAGGGLTIAVEPFEHLPDGLSAALHEEARDIGRFLGLPPQLAPF